MRLLLTIDAIKKYIDRSSVVLSHRWSKRMNIKADLEQIKADLTTQRDEMKVKVGLAKLDIKQEWQAAEDKTEQLFESIHNMTQDTKEELVKSTKQLGDELKKTYASIKARLM